MLALNIRTTVYTSNKLNDMAPRGGVATSQSGVYDFHPRDISLSGHKKISAVSFA